MRKLFLLISFFSIMPVMLLATSILLLSSSFQSKSENKVLSFLSENSSTIAYAALPTNLTMEADVQSSDARLGKVLAFLEENNSPLTPYASTIIADADKYGIDYRLLPAIAMQETTLCKTEIAGTNNCWGYGIYNHKITSFLSYEDAIDTISRYFAKKKANGIDTLDAIGNIYNPSNHNGWKENVSSFMSLL